MLVNILLLLGAIVLIKIVLDVSAGILKSLSLMAPLLVPLFFIWLMCT